MLEDVAILTSGRARHRGPRDQARVGHDRRSRPGQEGHDRQGPHDDHRGRRQLGGHRRPGQAVAAQVEDTTSDYDREKLQERLAKLVGGVAIIKVGAATETEMKEKKARVEDAMHATKAAVEEGIVAGRRRGAAAGGHGAARARSSKARSRSASPSLPERSRSRCAGSRPMPVTKGRLSCSA